MGGEGRRHGLWPMHSSSSNTLYNCWRSSLPPSLEATLPAPPQESIARRGFPPAWPSSPQVLALETCSGINKIRENSAMTGVVEGRMQHPGARKVTG